jgi:hypothetical protein
MKQELKLVVKDYLQLWLQKKYLKQMQILENIL